MVCVRKKTLWKCTAILGKRAKNRHIGKFSRVLGKYHNYGIIWKGFFKYKIKIDWEYFTESMNLDIIGVPLPYCTFVYVKIILVTCRPELESSN